MEEAGWVRVLSWGGAEDLFDGELGMREWSRFRLECTSLDMLKVCGRLSDCWCDAILLGR